MPSPTSGPFVSAVAYDRHVGRYGPALARAHVVAAGVEEEHRVLDVGCGPGALTQALAEVVGAKRVAAVDPSEPFVEECRRRVPDADVRVGTAEDLPDVGERDVALSQLVVNFMADPRAGVAAMRRTVRPGGFVTSCVWDYADGMTMLRAFWDAALELDPEAPDEGRVMRHCTEPELRTLWESSGLADVRTEELVVEASFQSFDDFWSAFPGGPGPSGAYCSSLDEAQREALREACFRRLGEPSSGFVLPARAWFVSGRA